MKFPTKPDIQMLSECPELKVDIHEKMPYAVYYLTGFINQQKVYEVTGLDQITSEEQQFLDMFGAQIPVRVQFRTVSSVVEAVIVYKNYKAHMTVDLFKFNLVGGNSESLKYDTSFVVTPEADNEHEPYVEASLAVIRDILLAFWLGE